MVASNTFYNPIFVNISRI